MEHDACETTRQRELDAASMPCREIVDVLTDYLEDALPPAARERVERHLARCLDCAAYVAQMRATIRLLGRLGEQAV